MTISGHPSKALKLRKKRTKERKKERKKENKFPSLSKSMKEGILP
jgi:hypothetical protein